jgi:iron complex outermembrane recepter protein
MNTRSARITRAVLCPVMAAGLISAAVAQVAPSAATTGDEKVTLEKFVVTGSNIPTAIDAVAVPVTILNRQDLETTGLDTNLLEVLQKRMPIFAGNGNLGMTNSNTAGNSTYGGSQISLRNLDTLVLLNNRRVPDSGVNGRGGRRFVDVNQFPMAAVQSIEVLTDGASAIYGSDAIGGVVNVKLRNDFNGAEAGARYAYSSRKGDYEEKSAYAVVGAKRGGINLTAGYMWSKIEPLKQADRPFSTPIVGRTATISGGVSPSSANFPTNFLRADLSSPSKAVPTGAAATAADLTALQASGIYPAATFQSIADSFDISPLVTLTLGSQKKAGLLAGSMTLVPDALEVFWDGIYSKSDTFSQLAAQPVTATVPANSPYNPTRSSLFAAFRYVPAPRQFVNTGELHRIVGGARGKFLSRFQWEAAYNYGSNKLTNVLRNVLYNPNLQLALAGGYNAAGAPEVGGKFARVFPNYSTPPGSATLAQWQAQVTPANTVVQPAFDVFARPEGVDPASIVNVFGASSLAFEAVLKGIDGRISTDEIWTLPGGRIGAAVGYSWAKESLSGVPDDNSRTTGPTAGRWAGATLTDPFFKDRDIKSAYAEVRIPIFGESMNIPGFRVLEASAAYRYEDYSDAGESKVPKYGIRWRPVGDDLTLRATYSKGFTAPTLFALNGPTTQGFSAVAEVPNVFGINGQTMARSGSNPNLKPSTAKTHSFGAVFSPKAIKGLTLSVDYIHIDQEQIVGSAGRTEIMRSVEAFGPASPYAAQVAIGNWPTNPDPTLGTATRITTAGQLGSYLRAGNSANLIFLTDSNINISGQQVRALDIAANYELPWKDYGRFTVGTTGTFFLHYKFQTLPSQPYFEYAGHVTNGGTGAEGVVPGMRWYSTTTWNKGPWYASLGHTWIDSVTDIGPGGITFVSSTTLKRVRIEAYSVVDASLGYTFTKNRNDTGWRRWVGGLRVTFGVNNIMDDMPPVSPQAYNDSNADVSTYSPIGRLYFLKADYKF